MQVTVIIKTVKYTKSSVSKPSIDTGTVHTTSSDEYMELTGDLVSTEGGFVVLRTKYSEYMIPMGNVSYINRAL